MPESLRNLIVQENKSNTLQLSFFLMCRATNEMPIKCLRFPCSSVLFYQSFCQYVFYLSVCKHYSLIAPASPSACCVPDHTKSYSDQEHII